MGDRGFFRRPCAAPVFVTPCPVYTPVQSCPQVVISPPTITTNSCGTVVTNCTPLAQGVTPSPITPSDENLRGSAILADLRSRALTRCLGDETFSSIVPEIQRRLGNSSDSQFVEIPHEVHSSATGIEGAFQGRTSHVTMANGVLGEFNQVVTFSVPVSEGNLRIRGYYFDTPTRTTSGWNSDSSFTPGNTNSQRFHNLYEVHVRREGDRYVYTVALTHGFVGGLRIDSRAGSMLLLSHQARPAPPTSGGQPLVTAPTTNPEVPAPEPLANNVSPPTLQEEAAPPPPRGLASTGSAGTASPLPPTSSSGNNSTIAGRTPTTGGAPLLASTGNGGAPPELSDGGSLGTPPPLTSNSNGGTGTITGNQNGGTQIAGASPPTTSSGNGGTLTTNNNPPALSMDDGPPAGPTLASGTLATPPPVLSNSDGLFTGLVRRISGGIPNISSIAWGNLDTGGLPPPVLAENGSGGAGSLASSGSAGTTVVSPPLAVTASPDGSRPVVNGTGPVVAAVPRYSAPQFPLPPYIPPTVPTSEENRIRALSLAVLGQFTVRPMHDTTSGVRLPNTDAANQFFGDVVDACYYLPETAFGHLSRFTNPQRAEDRDHLDSLESLTSAVLGTGRENPARGSSFGVGTRTNDIITYLEANPRLAAGTQSELREIRYRLVSMAGPLQWAARYVDQRQMEQTQGNGGTPATLLEPTLRPTSHHPLTVALQGTFRRVFGAQQIPSTHVWTQAMTAIQNLDGNRLESVTDFSTQDVLAIRSLLLTAREARNNPGFLAQFTASRQTQVQTQILPLLAAGSGGNVAEAPVLQYFQATFGAEATNQNRAEILRLVRTLNGNNSPARQREVAGQLLQPFSAQMTFGDAQLRELDTALTRLEAYNNRIRLLLRAQSVSEDTDQAVGQFLSLLPDTPGTPARANPSQADFETRLTRALGAIEGEYALLSSRTVDGTYATTRREILRIYLRDLKDHLLREGGEWGAFVQGTPARQALRTRLDRAFPANATATELPADPIALIESFSELMRLGGPAMPNQDSLNLMMRIIRGRTPSNP